MTYSSGYVLRPAAPYDRDAVTQLIRARADWLDEHGHNGTVWRRDAGKLAEQCGHPAWTIWLLVRRNSGRVAARLGTVRRSPPWLFPDAAAETAEESLFVHGTVSHPEFRGAGGLAVRGMVHVAAAGSYHWVRRGTTDARLLAYYQTQGFSHVSEVERRGTRVYGLQRRALLSAKPANVEVQVEPAVLRAGDILGI